MALKDFRVKNGITVESGDITLNNGNINFSNGYMQTDNIKIDGNTISSTNTNGDINVTPNGTGYVMIDGVRWPNALGSNGKFLQTNGSGHLSWVTVATDLSEDTSPQLGGHLDTNNFKITATGSNDMIFEKDDGAFIFRDVDNTGAEVRIGPNNILFNHATDGGASGGEATLQYIDSGGVSRNLLTIGDDIMAFENRAANGIIQFYANTAVAGSSGRVHVMTIADTLITAKKNIKLDDADLKIDNNKGIWFYESNGNGSNYGKIQFPASITSDFTLTFPGDDGNSGQVLTTDGSGVLSWTSKTVDTNTNTTYSTSVVDSSGIKLRLTAGGSGSGTDDVKFAGSGATSVARTDASTITISSTDTTYSEATSSSQGLMSTAHHDKLDGIETGATADQSNAEIRAAVEAASDSNVFTDADHSKLNGIAANANNYSILSDLLDEDSMSSNSATKAASQQSIKAYVASQVSDLVASAPAALDTLNELAAAINDDASFSTTMSDALGNRLRVDGTFSYTSTQQSNALTNLGFTATLQELNVLDGYTGSVTELNYLDALHGTGVTSTEFDYLDGVTSNIQTQLDSKIGAVRTVTAGGNTLATSETLAFTAGSNVTITESGGAVTINSTAGGLSDIVSDTSPQLGGNLDLQTHSIVTGSGNNDITLAPHGTGDVVIQTSLAGVGVGPGLVLKRVDGTPTDDDWIGQLRFDGSDDEDNSTSYAAIRGRVTDVTDSTEDGVLEFLTRINGAWTEVLEVSRGLSIFGANGLSLYDDDNSHYIKIKTPVGLSNTWTLALPADNGSANQVLKTDGNGVTSWVDQSGGAVSAVANGADNRIATFSSATALNGEETFTYDGVGNMTIDTGASGAENDATIILKGYTTSDSNRVAQPFVAFNDTDSVANMTVVREGANDAAAITLGTQPTGGTITERMRIDSTGNVGIRHTNPSADLHVVGETGTSASIYISDGDDSSKSGDALIMTKSGSHAYIRNRDSGALRLGTNDTNDMVFISNSGDVGIGTSSPGTPIAANAKGLVVAGTGGQSGSAQDGSERIPTIVLYDTVTDYGSGTATVGEARGSIEFYSSETSNNYPGIAASIKAINESTYNSAMGLGLFTSNNLATATEKVRINADGNVGINDSSPDKELSIIGIGGGNADIDIARTSGATINLQAQASNGIIGTSSNHNLGLKTNGSVRMTIATDGDVGIGDSTPSYKLDVNGSIRAVDDIYTDKLIASEGIRSSNRASFNTMTYYYFDRQHVGTNAWYLRVPVGGSSTENPASYFMPHAGQVMQVLLGFYGQTLATSGTDTWTIYVREPDDTLHECDFDVNFANLVRVGTGNNYSILVDVSVGDNAISFPAGSTLAIKRTDTSPIDVENVTAQIWITFDI